MSESSKKIIKYFCDRFLEIDYYPSSIGAIFDMEIKVLKSFNESVVNNFKDFGVKIIRDFSNLSLDDIEKIVNDGKIKPSLIKSAFIATKLITQAWKKRSSYLKKAQMKVVIAGLDFAGKTSIINRLMNINYTEIIN